MICFVPSRSTLAIGPEAMQRPSLVNPRVESQPGELRNQQISTALGRRGALRETRLLIATIREGYFVHLGKVRVPQWWEKLAGVSHH